MRKLFSLIAAVLFAGSTMTAFAVERYAALAAGDTVVLINKDATRELTGVESSLGTATVFTETPTGTFALVVEAGVGENTFAFRNGDNYLAWTAGLGNKLTTATAKDSTSSWTVTIDENLEAVVANLGDATRQLQYNSSSPRFCCYTGSQQKVSFAKLGAAEEEEEEEPVADEVVIYDWKNKIGVTILGGNSNIAEATVKINKNTNEVKAIKFGSSYAYADGKYVAIKPAEGGFKAGDVLYVAAVFSNDADNKLATVDLRAADGATPIWLSDSAKTINGKTSEAAPIVQTYTLEADQDSLLMGRKGNTGLFIVDLLVGRPAAEEEDTTEIPMPIVIPTVKEAADTALTVSGNNVPLNDGQLYAVSGYVTEVTYAYSESSKNMSFWMADSVNGGQVLQAYKAELYETEDIPAVGDLVAVMGQLTKYNNKPQFAAGSLVTVIEKAPQDTTPIEPVEIKTYEVSEAIAAAGEGAIKNNDSIAVRGVIVKMEAKGANFNTYGSVNIYVADAVNPDSILFEFYNCYSMLGDTFKTTTPELPNDSYAEMISATDGNGFTVALGDTIIAMGKYTYFAKYDQHELNTGCYIVDIKKAEIEPIAGDTIALEFTYGEVYTEDFAEWGAVDVLLTTQAIDTVNKSIGGDGVLVILDIIPENANDITGLYQSDSLTIDLDHSEIIEIAGTDTAEIAIDDAKAYFQVLEVAKEYKTAQLGVILELIAETGDMYTALCSVVVYYEFIEEQGVENVEATEKKAIKKIEMGQLVIEKNGVKYNASGAVIR